MTLTDQEIPATQETMLMFAYGTLRSGEALHQSYLGENVVRKVGVGFIRNAKLFYSASHDYYPVLVFTTHSDDRAVGEIFEVPVNDEIVDMFHMEMAAGYKVAEAFAEVEGEEFTVTVCAWDKAHGREVPENDWCSKDNKEWW